MRAVLGRLVPPLLLSTSLLAAAAPASPQEVQYYHLDALGSVRAVTNQAGAVVERHDYLPFGEEWNLQPGAQPKRFTGKERDAETGLDYFGARYYGNKVGRFTTVDPVYTWQGNLVDPQLWNRYVYARNNPLRYTDPDGRFIPALVIGGAVLYALLTSPDIANAPGPNDPTYKSDQTGKLFLNAAIGVALMRGIFGAELAQPPDQDDTKDVTISRRRSPEAAKHIEDAQAAGHPDVVTIDRSRARPNRSDSMQGVPRAETGFDRDEYPPACCAEGGAGASVRPIPRGDNRSAGGQLGQQIKDVPDGTRVRIRTKDE